jgi:hypothetical protein
VFPWRGNLRRHQIAAFNALRCALQSSPLGRPGRRFGTEGSVNFSVRQYRNAV